MIKLIKQDSSEYEPQKWITKDGKFVVTNISDRYRGGACYAKTIGFKYEVEGNGGNYKTNTLEDAKWWIEDQQINAIAPQRMTSTTKK